MIVNNLFGPASRFVRSWTSGNWLRGMQLEPRPPSALMQLGHGTASARLRDRRELPASALGAVQALSQVLDRQARAGMVCPSLAVVEHMLLSQLDDPLRNVSPWILRQASLQLEALSNTGGPGDLGTLYRQMRSIADDACFR
jgi:hypothetical protein